MWEYRGWTKENYERYIDDMIATMSNCRNERCVFYDDKAKRCERHYIAIEYAMSLPAAQAAWGERDKPSYFQREGEVLCISLLEMGECGEESCGE